MRRIKKGPFIILLFLLVVSVTILVKPKLKIDLYSTEINVNEDYKLDFKAKYKSEDVTEKVGVDSKISNSVIGRYNVIFNYGDNKTTKTVKVVDKVAPSIVLKRGDSLVVSLNSEYVEPGYDVKDNYDKDLKVNISGEVDTTKLGEYIVKYSTKDNSGNRTEVIRSVVVTDQLPTDLAIKDFSLDGYFNDTIIKQTADAGNDYINKFIFAGDSVPLYYVISNHISGTQLWHKEGINAESALVQPIYIAHQTTDLTFIDAFKKYQPNYVIMTLGMNSVATMTSDYFISCYKKIINGIQEVSPNTVLIINSIPPVDSSLDEVETGLTNKKINLFNYKILEMCNELGIKFLNSAVILKDENGQCKKGYCYLEKNNYGIHQTTAGNDKIFEYIRTHAIN